MNIDDIKAIGLMSGTSADGLSVVYARICFSKRKVDLIKYKTYNYEKKLTLKIINARDFKLHDIVELHYELGKVWYDMVKRFLKEFKIKPSDVDLIASHGQTVYHSSLKKQTYQIGEVEFISRLLKIPVVYDFRVGDIVFGGEGAPLVPFFDEFLFGKNNFPVGLLNIGGVSNITVTGSGIKTYGFDIGPGNTLMDWAISIYSNGKKRYDRDGNLALKGKVDFRKIERFMKNSFFNLPPPKSLDREEFGKEFVLKNFDFQKENIEDILATLNYFTAYSVYYSVRRFVKERIKKLIISGGGVYNKTLFENIRKLLSDVEVESIEKYKIHPLAKEPLAFALLGAARFLNVASNVVSVTGAKNKVVLGKISF